MPTIWIPPPPIVMADCIIRRSSTRNVAPHACDNGRSYDEVAMSFHVGGRLSSVALGAVVLVLWGMPAGADVQSGSADAVVGQSDLSSAVCNRRTSPRTTPSAP